MRDIFVSYSRQDQDIVLPFVQSIEQRFGSVCWIDLDGIESGSQFEDVIVDAIDACKVVLFMLSDNSLDSKWTKREVLYAEKRGKRIVPIVIDGKGLRKWFEFHFCDIDYVDLKSPEQQEKLFRNLATWLGGKVKTNVVSQNTSPSNVQHKLVISDDGKEIKFNIVEGCDLVLKKDVEKGRYVGEFPIEEIAEKLKHITETEEYAALKESTWHFLKGSVGGAITGGLTMGLLGVVGSAVGAVAGGYLGYKQKVDEARSQVFEAILANLNAKYGVCLKKCESEESEFIVELYR